MYARMAVLTWSRTCARRAAPPSAAWPGHQRAAHLAHVGQLQPSALASQQSAPDFSARRGIVRAELVLTAAAAASRQALVSELGGLKLKVLKKRARAAGVDEEKLEDTDDADDIKGAVIALIVHAELSLADDE